jgi:mRNA interferase RelE/StbE
LKVFLSRKAAKARERLSSAVRRRVEEKLSQLTLTPYPADCRKLRGAGNAYRIRIGDCRLLYTILNEDEILVFKISRRESAYE